MAATTLTPGGNLDQILKDFYSGPIRDQLNNEMLIFDLFQRRKMNWTGRKVIMPVRTTRNGSGAFKAEGAALPSASENGYKDLLITSKYLYGRMSITGPAIAQAKASVGAFVNGLQQELDGAIESVKNAADAAAFVGGGCAGFIHQHIASATHQFSGNLEKLPLNAAAAVNCVLVRLDTYATVGAGLTVKQAAAAGSVLFSAPVDLTALPSATAVAVVIQDDAAGLPSVDEAEGIYGNLGGGTFAAPLAHFGVDRSTATGTATALQSTVVAVADNGDRSALNVKRMQAVLDEVADKSGTMPDCLVAHYILRQEYTGLMTADGTSSLLRTDARGGATNADAGFNMGGLSFNGIPLKVSRHCGKGLLVFLNLKSWTVAEVQAPGLADLDGSVLSRESNTDSYEAFVRYYYNTVCTAPNRNGILVGIDYAGV